MVVDFYHLSLSQYRQADIILPSSVFTKQTIVKTPELKRIEMFGHELKSAKKYGMHVLFIYTIYHWLLIKRENYSYNSFLELSIEL